MIGWWTPFPPSLPKGSSLASTPRKTVRSSPMPPRSSAARRAQSSAAPETVDLGVLKDMLGFRLRRIQNHLSKNFAERLAGRDIKPGEFSALALIAANPG